MPKLRIVALLALLALRCGSDDDAGSGTGGGPNTGGSGGTADSSIPDATGDTSAEGSAATGGGANADAGDSADDGDAACTCVQPETCGGGGLEGECGHPGCTSGVWGSGALIAYGSTGRPNIAVDPEGGLHVVYRWSTSAYYLHRAPGSSSWDQVDLLSELGSGAPNDVSIAVDASGGAHVAALMGSSLRYVAKSGASPWIAETIDPDALPDTLSLAMDGSGTPHVAYLVQGDVDGSDVYLLKHAWRLGVDSWSTELIDDSAYARAPRIRASDSKLHALYIVWDGSSEKTVYAERPLASGSWVREDVGINHVSSNLGFAVDSAGVPHAAFQGPGSMPEFLHLQKTGGAWTSEVANPTGSCAYGCSNGTNSALVVDSWGQVHATFEVYRKLSNQPSPFDFSQTDFYTGLRSSSGAWSSDNLDSIGTNCFVGSFSDVALDPWNGVHTVYSSDDPQDCDDTPVLKYAYRCP